MQLSILFKKHKNIISTREIIEMKHIKKILALLLLLILIGICYFLLHSEQEHFVPLMEYNEQFSNTH